MTVGIKFLSFDTTLKAVSTSDEAIDLMNEGTDLKKYREEYDISFLKFKEGMTPTYFNLANVPGPDLVVIQQDHYVTELPEIKAGMTMEEMQSLKVKIKPINQGMMLVKYFKASCKSITDDGKTYDVTEEVIKTIPPSILQEIGSFVMTRTILSDSKKK
jgi:hypothetical protein